MKEKIWYPIYRFWDDYSPKQLYRKAKYFYQRGRRGWSDRDWWSTDYYLKSVIPAMLRKYAKDGISYPGRYPFETAESWHKALLKAADDIEAYYIFDEKDHDLSTKEAIEQYHVESQAAQKRTQEGMQFVTDNFLSLWD